MARDISLGPGGSSGVQGQAGLGGGLHALLQCTPEMHALALFCRKHLAFPLLAGL